MQTNGRIAMAMGVLSLRNIVLLLLSHTCAWLVPQVQGISHSDVMVGPGKPGFDAIGSNLHIRLPDDWEFLFADQPVESTTSASPYLYTPTNDDDDMNGDSNATNVTTPPTRAPSLSPTLPPIRVSIRQIRDDIRAQISSLSETHTKEEILTIGSIGESLSTAVAETADRKAFYDQLYGCVSQVGAAGSDGGCVALVPRCQAFQHEATLNVTYSPDSLAFERLAGTIAKFECASDTQYIPEEFPMVATCLTSQQWSNQGPDMCRNCSEKVEFCERCTSRGRCVECQAGLTLVMNESGLQSCVTPPGSAQSDPAQDCDELKHVYGLPSGVYWLRGIQSSNESHHRQAVRVYCDQDTLGGGWTLVFKMQESLPEGGFEREFAGVDAQHLWILGCGEETSIGCYGLGPDVPGWRSVLDSVHDNNGASLRSVDWSAFMEAGERYDIRQSVGLGQAENMGSEEMTGVLDVVYEFEYPDFVVQDHAPDDTTTTNVTWQLRNKRIITDKTGVFWDQDFDVVFFPPWSTGKRGNVACGLSSFYFGDSSGVRFAAGSAGISNTNGLLDPVGVSWMPHMPQDSSSCGIYGPHQGGIVNRISNWCGQPNLQGAYWLRRVR